MFTMINTYFTNKPDAYNNRSDTISHLKFLWLKHTLEYTMRWICKIYCLIGRFQSQSCLLIELCFQREGNYLLPCNQTVPSIEYYSLIMLFFLVCTAVLLRGLDGLSDEKRILDSLADITSLAPKNCYVMRNLLTNVSLGWVSSYYNTTFTTL